MYGSNLKDCHHSPKYPNVLLSLFLAIKSRDHWSCYLHVWQYLFGHMSQLVKIHIYIISALYTWALAWQPSSLAEWLATSMSMLRLFSRVRWFVLPKLLCHFDWFDLGCNLWPNGQNFDPIQCWYDQGQDLEFSEPWGKWIKYAVVDKLSSQKGIVSSQSLMFDGMYHSLEPTYNWREEIYFKYHYNFPALFCSTQAHLPCLPV